MKFGLEVKDQRLEWPLFHQSFTLGSHYQFYNKRINELWAKTERSKLRLSATFFELLKFVSMSLKAPQSTHYTMYHSSRGQLDKISYFCYWIFNASQTDPLRAWRIWGAFSYSSEKIKFVRKFVALYQQSCVGMKKIYFFF